MTHSTSPPRIFLIGNAGKPRVVETFEGLAQWLTSKDMLAGHDLSGRLESLNAARPDYVVALGGDGTILHAGQAMQHRQVPIIGVNMGKLGYLADFDVSELRQNLDDILANSQLVSPRMMFDVRIVSPEGEPWEGVALNDCVIRVGDPFRTIGMELRIDDRPLCTLAGDGVILATPTGSTAHNMSCGGPIVEPGIEAIIVTPNSPHSFTHRPVVVSPESRVCVRMQAQSAGVAAVLDGQCVRHISPDTEIQVSKSKSQFQLVRNPARGPWDMLVTKLKWGQDIS